MTAATSRWDWLIWPLLVVGFILSALMLLTAIGGAGYVLFSLLVTR